MSKQVLITGGTGFIGWWMAGYTSFDVTVMSHALYDQLPNWPLTVDWDYIIHLAPVPVDRVIEWAKHSHAAVLLASSGGVYDRNPEPYFVMKKQDEDKLLASGLDVKIARIFATCGSHMKWHKYAIGAFIMQAEAGGPIQVKSYGHVVRSYLYGSDLAEWLWTILLHGSPCSVYNVGSDVPHSTQELAFEIAGHYDPQPKVEVIQKLAYEPRPFYVPDISRARDELGLTVKVPFDEAVRRTVEDYRNER